MALLAAGIVTVMLLVILLPPVCWLNLMWSGPAPRGVFELYIESSYAHVDDYVRLDVAGANPRVGCMG